MQAGSKEFEQLQCAGRRTWRSSTRGSGAGAAPQTTRDHFSLKLDVDCWNHPHKRTDSQRPVARSDCMSRHQVWARATPSYWHEYLEMELRRPLEAGTRHIAGVLDHAGPASATGPATASGCTPTTHNHAAGTSTLATGFRPRGTSEQLLDARGAWTKAGGASTLAGRRAVHGDAAASDDGRGHALTNASLKDSRAPAPLHRRRERPRRHPPGTAPTPKPKASRAAAAEAEPGVTRRALKRRWTWCRSGT